MPEAGDYHVLNRARLAISQYHFCPFLTDAGALMTFRTGFFGAGAGRIATDKAGIRWIPFAQARYGVTLRTNFRFYRLPIPLLVLEMVVRFHEVVDREVVLAIE